MLERGSYTFSVVSILFCQTLDLLAFYNQILAIQQKLVGQNLSFTCHSFSLVLE